MKKLFTKSVSVFLAMLLVMTSLSLNVLAKDTDDEKARAAEYDALEFQEDITLSYKVSGYEVQAQKGNFFSTKLNIGNFLIHKVPLPRVPLGKQLDQFIFRTGTATNNIVMLRMDYAQWDFSTVPVKYGADSEQMKPITTSGYQNYSIVDGSQVRISGGHSYELNYADITTYAKECIANGQDHFYMAVGCYASTNGVAQGCMSDSDYLKYNFDPKVLYSFKDATKLELVSSSVEDGAEDVAADSEISFEFTNDIAIAEVMVNGEAAECTIDGTTVFVESDFEECADFEVGVNARDTYGQRNSASVKFSTGLKEGAIVPENPSLGTYNVKCALSGDCSKLNELSFKLLTEFDDINSAIEIREIGGEALDSRFILDEETLRYNIDSALSLETDTAYEAVIKAGAEDKYGNLAEKDIVITKFLAGTTSTDEFADSSDCDFTVDVDKENSTLDIWFKNPVYSNREVELSVLCGDEVVVSQTVTTGARGIITLSDVGLSESGEYTVRICPANSPECFGMVYDFYTAEDILLFWNMIANDGTAEDICNNIDVIFALFALDNNYMVEITDFAVLAEKIVALRTAGLGEMNADNEESLKALVNEASLFTAFEQCRDAETIKSYVDDNFETLKAANTDVCSRWTERMATSYAEKIASELASAEKTINSYKDITTAMDVPLLKYSVENIKAQEYEALSDVVDIPDAYALGGGKISDDSGNFTSTKVGSGNMVIYKIVLPALPEGKTIDKFILRTGSSSGNLVALKMTHVMPELTALPMDMPESFAPIYAADTYKQYSAVEDTIIAVKGYANLYKLNYIDISSYAKECLADGYKYMYVGVGCYSSSLNVANGCMTDTDYTKAGLDPKYIVSFGDPDANGFVSSTVENNAEDVAADAKVAFKFINAVGSAVATLNGESAEVTIKGREVSLKNPLKECTDFELTISATDIFGQKASKTIRFSTGFKAGSLEAETPAIGVYSVKYNVDTAANELMELSFSLLSKFADINQAIEIREIGGDKVDSEFVFYDTDMRYDIATPVALSAGKAYEAVIKKGISDIYGNTADEDIVIAKFYAGETPDTEITDDGAVVEASFDAENATLSVYFKNSVYANSEIDITIEDEDSPVYSEKATAGKSGVVTLEGIELAESGDYILKISPKSAPGVYKKDIAFYKADDIEKYWNMVAADGKAADIASNWGKIEFIFGLSNVYLNKVSDYSSLASKIEAQRSGFDEMTANAIESLRVLVTDLSYFAAIEQAKSADDKIALIDAEFDTLVNTNKDICNEWTQALASEFVNEFKTALGQLDAEVDSYKDATDYMDKALDSYRLSQVLQTVGNAFHSTEIKTIISNPKYAKLLGVESLVNRYMALNSTVDVDMAMKKKFDSAQSFAKAFEQAIVNAEASNNYDSSDFGGGGNGGSSSGKGGSSGFQIVSSAPVDKAPFSPFADIDSVPWAKEHIVKLYNSGVINGKSAVSFAPYDKITREEFTKLISSMMKLSDNGTAGEFYDVNASDWYAPYVKAAVSNGVCQGIGGGYFGTGYNATRQDIAVMITNALKVKGVEITSDGASFKDSSAISDYAQSAVSFLGEKGVITGDENGMFNPKSNATRAEVAVMLSRVNDIFLKEVK